MWIHHDVREFTCKVYSYWLGRLLLLLLLLLLSTYLRGEQYYETAVSLAPGNKSKIRAQLQSDLVNRS